MKIENRKSQIAALVLLAALGGVGCQGKSKGEFHGVTRITYPDGVVIERNSDTRGESVTPNDAKEPSTISVSEDGVNASVSGSWEIKAVDYAKRNAAFIFPIAAVIFIAAAALAFWRMQITFGVCLVVAAGACLAAQYLSIVFAWLIGLAVAAGVVWLVAQLIHGRTIRIGAMEDFAKLVSEGKTKEAIAALRASDPKLNEAFQA